jgi:hypothetical protein
VPRSDHTATVLQDGRVLVTGGSPAPPSATPWSSAELFDPGTGTFTLTAPMTRTRVDHTATLLADGRVLLAGGWDGTETLSAAELFDPATGAFTPTGSMTSRRTLHAAVRLLDGRVLVAGGTMEGPLETAPLASAELYDPATGTFSALPDMATPRNGLSATRLRDGRVLLALGNVHGRPFAELFDPAAARFVPTSPMLDGWGGGQPGTLLDDGTVMIGTFWLYDPVTDMYSNLARSGRHPGSGPGETMTQLPSGSVLAAGGDGIGFGNGTRGTALYDPATHIFTTVTAANMTVSRTHHTASLLANGSVLIVGGDHDATTGGEQGAEATAELFTQRP